MTPGPLRRLVGTLGLLALTPIAYLLLTGAVDPLEAATRAVIVLLVVVVLGRITGLYLRNVADRFERRVRREVDLDVDLGQEQPGG